jgi:hypothetical protein
MVGHVRSRARSSSQPHGISQRFCQPLSLGQRASQQISTRWGGLPLEQQSALAAELRRTLDWVHGQTEILFSRTPAARELWNDRYAALSQGREDAYGAATSCTEAQVPPSIAVSRCVPGRTGLLVKDSS